MEPNTIQYIKSNKYWIHWWSYGTILCSGVLYIGKTLIKNYLHHVHGCFLQIWKKKFKYPVLNLHPSKNMKLWYMWATCIIHEKKFLYEWITCVSSEIFKSTVNYNKDSFNSLIIILKYVKWLNKCDLAMYMYIITV